MADIQEKASDRNEKKAEALVISSRPDETDGLDTTSSEDPTRKAIPWTYKWVALACVIAFPIGQTWTNASLGPLKNTLREELGITNAQFGVIASADSFINSIFPVLGGMILDWWGPNPITICCTCVILVGSVIAAVAIHVSAWRVLVTGHIVMGFGMAILDQAQQKVAHKSVPVPLFNFVSTHV